MSKNKKNFIIGQMGSGIVFFIGILYLLVPTYYGLNNMVNIDTNSLFISLSIIYGIIHFGFYYIIGKNPTNESLIVSLLSLLTGVLNLLMSRYLNSSINLSISVLVFTISITVTRLFTVDYYHDRKDAYFYIEGFLLTIFFITGLIISISLFNDPLIQTIELGFFLMIMGILDSTKIATKCLLKAPRFLGKIKF